MISSSLFLLNETTWPLERRLFFPLPKPQERKVRSQCPLHRLSWAKVPVGNLDDAVPDHLLSARCPFSGAEGHSNQAFGVQGVPDFLGSFVWQRIVLVLVDEQGKFADGQEGGDELGTDADAWPLSNRAIQSQGPALPSSEAIGKVLLRPGIVLTDIYRSFGTLAGIERSGDKTNDAANSEDAPSQVVFPVAGEEALFLEKRQGFFFCRDSFQVATQTE